MYKAAISYSPGFDPFALVLYECYLGLPQDNLEGYRHADALQLAATLKGEFMLVCGTSDHVTWSDAVKMSEALIRAGKPHEFVVLPEQHHYYDLIHESYFWKKVARFFEQHLGLSAGG
jgi:dipeptidyl aminopeptidase/acylaminoacyl peptidase